MNRYSFIITKPLQYYVAVEAESLEAANAEIQQRIRIESYGEYARSVGAVQAVFNGKEVLTPKKYRVRLYRELFKDVEIEATNQDEAEEFGLGQAENMDDCEFDCSGSEAETLEVIYEKKDENV